MTVAAAELAAVAAAAQDTQASVAAAATEAAVTAAAQDATATKGGVGVQHVFALAQALDATVTVSNPVVSAYAAPATTVVAARAPLDVLIGAWGYGPRPAKVI